MQGNGRSNGGRFEDIDLEAGTSPRYDSAQTSDKYMDEFFQEVSVIKVCQQSGLSRRFRNRPAGFHCVKQQAPSRQQHP